MGAGCSGKRMCDSAGKGEGLSHSRSAEEVGVAGAQGGGGAESGPWSIPPAGAHWREAFAKPDHEGEVQRSDLHFPKIILAAEGGGLAS